MARPLSCFRLPPRNRSPSHPFPRGEPPMDRLKGIGAHGKEIMGDIPNYTDLAPQIQVSEIVVA